MTYLFMGMIIGGCLGIVIGSLVMALWGKTNEVHRLKKEVLKDE